VELLVYLTGKKVSGEQCFEVEFLIFLTGKKKVSGEQYECVSFIRKTECFEQCSSIPSVGVWFVSFLFFPK